jgi:hypothetical protein
VARDLTAAMLTALAQGTIRPVLIAAFEFSAGTVRVWNGVGDLVFEGNTYNGLGNFGGVSTVEEGNDLRASGLTFQLTGVPTSLLSVALGEIEYGRPATLWLGFTDNTTGLLVDEPVIMFRGLTDNAQISEDGASATINLAVENRLVALEIAKPRRFTSQDQQTAYPGDLGFDFVPSLQDLTLTWGRGVVPNLRPGGGDSGR